MASVACSNRPTQVEPTLNIDALAEASKVIDALVDAKVKEVVAALPTSTPYPTYTSVPIPSPVPTYTTSMPTPSLSPTITPVPLSTPTHTSVPPPTVTPHPTVISRGTLPIFTWPTATPDQTGASNGRITGPNIDDEWLNNLESLIHRWVNSERRKNNLPDLEYDPTLAYISRLHSQDMADFDYLSHSNKKDETPEDRAKKTGYICQNKRIGDWVYSGLGQEIAWHSTVKNVRRDKDFKIITDYYTPQEMASEIVSGESGWLVDDRESMILQDNYPYVTDGVGAAVAVNKPNRVYVTLTFSACNFKWRS